VTESRDPLQILREASLPTGFEERLLLRLEQESKVAPARVIPLMRRPRLWLAVAVVAIPTAAAAMATSSTVRARPVAQVVSHALARAQAVVARELTLARASAAQSAIPPPSELEPIPVTPEQPPTRHPAAVEQPPGAARVPRDLQGRKPAREGSARPPAVPARPTSEDGANVEAQPAVVVAPDPIEVVDPGLPHGDPTSPVLADRAARLREATRRAGGSEAGEHPRGRGETDVTSNRGKGGEGRGEGVERRSQEKAQERARKGQ